ncbi:hypothetical protein CC86DRAFT_303390 [Ophiobolus disseminans]|uniref:Uncharacterized protein n=1 Tax=Ophiobolus disseminans TaxID=1469910 RepID=A0A6A6ZIM3_9PLEO|nr:hypothetical protein CC86DRAFT_303390 [Ophiobolus disseminans]
MSSSYHIPFPRNFLTVNTPVKKSTSPDAAVVAAAVQPQQPDHGFLSNRPAARHQSVSSVSSIASSDAAPSSAPSSPPAKALDSPVLAAKSFTPLALNAKHAPAVPSLADMTPVARSAFLSNRY